MIVYKIDVMKTLKEKGFTSHYLRTNKILPESTMQMLRHNQIVSIKSIETLCGLLDLQPGDIVSYKKD